MQRPSAPPPIPPDAPGAWRPWHVAAALAVSALGLALRFVHAQTFNSAGRASDYGSVMDAVQWLTTHEGLFDAGMTLHHGYHGPLWYVLAAFIVEHLHAVRPIAYVSVAAWGVRQVVLAKIVRAALPQRPVAGLLALGLSAALPISVLVDGKIYNESLHAALFAVALWFLFKIERQGAVDVRSVRRRDALAFGAFAGLAMLTKTTALVLVACFALLLGAWAWREGTARLRATTGRLAAVALTGAASWLAVAGWWCLSNYRKFHHPFPHQYMLRQVAVMRDHPIVAEPLAYRRPIGWALPVQFEWLGWPYGPWNRPNFWANLVAGTWSDILNRGLCRSRLPGPTVVAWRDATRVNLHCLDASRLSIWIGCFLTAAAVWGAAALARQFVRSRGRNGSLVVPASVALTVVLLLAFGASYPFDHHPVTKANYALGAAVPLCACFAFTLAGVPRTAAGRALEALVALAIGAVGALVALQVLVL
jgi:hypothetical protein